MRPPKRSLLVALVLCLTPAGAHAQRQPALTAQDRLDIGQLVARYARAVDTRDANVLVDLFAPDGEFVSPSGTARGRERLAALASSGVITPTKPEFGVSHFNVNHLIEPAPDGAVGKEYVVIAHIAESGKPGGDFSNIGGHYEDAYVKTSGGWRFKRRQFIPSAFAAPTPRAAAAPPRAPAPAPIAAPPASSRPPASLTADDYLAIRALANTYAYGLDTGAKAGQLYASIFTEDAEFHGPPAVPGGKPFDAKGREALRQFALVDRGSGYVRHFMFNHLIESAPEGARGKVYLMVIDIGQAGKPTSVNMGGHYEDTYVKTGDGWRIKTRHFFRSKSAQTIKAETDAASATSQPK